MIRRSLTTVGGRSRTAGSTKGSHKQSETTTEQSVSDTCAMLQPVPVASEEGLSFAQALPILLAEDSTRPPGDDDGIGFELVRELFESMEQGDPNRLQIIYGSERHAVDCTESDTIADVVHRFMYSRPLGQHPRAVKCVRKTNGESLKASDAVWDCCKMDDVLVFDDWAVEDFLVKD